LVSGLKVTRGTEIATGRYRIIIALLRGKYL
jgi:hypothetical protein